MPISLLLTILAAAGDGPGMLEASLLREQPAALAAEAIRDGDPARGALVFFRPDLSCARCHAGGAVGPDLAKPWKDATDSELVEALLAPSKRVRKGYETASVLMVDGGLVTGLLVSRNAAAVVIKEARGDGRPFSIPLKEVERVKIGGESLMPAGQVNQLASRQQFLDLVAYLAAVRDGGAERAAELQPPPTLVSLPLPDYETRINHAGMIRGWNAESLKRGEAIYGRICAHCHGTRNSPGSLPTAPRFAEGKLKNGTDPLALYRTLTHGFGMMTPQPWMVPQQKYDVIYYLREKYFKPGKATTYATVDEPYLKSLPTGDTFGPPPNTAEPWRTTNYGPFLINTYEIPGATKNGAPNLAYKGIAYWLGGGASSYEQFAVFEHDTLRWAGVWNSQGLKDKRFIDWHGIQFDGAHNAHAKAIGRVTLANSVGPGWSLPGTESFADDRRVIGRDGRRYGPLPASWGKYRGLYLSGAKTAIAYTIGETEVLESPASAEHVGPAPAFVRTLRIGPRKAPLTLQIAEDAGADDSVWRPGPKQRFGIHPPSGEVAFIREGSALRAKIAAGDRPLKFSFWHAPSGVDRREELAQYCETLDPAVALKPQRGLWRETLKTTALLGPDAGPFAVDVLTHPVANPWQTQMRFTGLDFFDDGDRMAVCTWDGDVWLVSGLNAAQKPGTATLMWKRFASGLFQPLGLKIVSGKVHVLCRDQLAVLHDRNADDEADFYECLNSDHQVTEHFHEFAMGLQTDAEGNFYYAKSARHALPAIVPHHGTLLKIAKDGSRTDVLAAGFRAANGVCLNPDGSFIVTDQEGHWNPKNRINWVKGTGPAEFHGNSLGYHAARDTSDAAMEQPLCWITNAFDRSPAELLYVKSKKWRELDGALLNLSYGYGKVYVVPHENVNGVWQGGMCEFPLPPFPTGLIRGRFHPQDGHLYLCGMYAWAGSAIQPGGLYRLRRTENPVRLPSGLHATTDGMEITFTTALAESATADLAAFEVKTWTLRRTANYGSAHHDERTLQVTGASLSPDRRTLRLAIANMNPAQCMEIKYRMKAADGGAVRGTIHNTVHRLAEPEGTGGRR
ncbi:MAG TPA: DUF6797 domain-containing protein [Planctomycetia bacterium]|nr:DUF6797 domain-containing protein [Planctomycetia bacterium]